MKKGIALLVIGCLMLAACSFRSDKVTSKSVSDVINDSEIIEFKINKEALKKDGYIQIAGIVYGKIINENGVPNVYLAFYKDTPELAFYLMTAVSLEFDTWKEHTAPNYFIDWDGKQYEYGDNIPDNATIEDLPDYLPDDWSNVIERIQNGESIVQIIDKNSGDIIDDEVEIFVSNYYESLDSSELSYETEESIKDENDNSYQDTVVQNNNESNGKLTPEPTIVESSTEITFRDIPWETSFAEIDQMYGSLNWLPIAGESFVNPSVDAILLDNDYAGIDFEYNDINIVANALNIEWNVAGYKPTDIELHFAYTLVDGLLPKTEENSALYGAKYYIEPADLESAKNDLIGKISSLYGNSAKQTTDSDYSGNKIMYYYWYGANDTELVLKSLDSSGDSTGFYKDQIVIAYAWRKGDELMQSASDALKSEEKNNESGVYGNNSTDGL